MAAGIKTVKISDDYQAKLRLWASARHVMALPRLEGLPRFGAKKFRSYDEMNAWKMELLREIATQGGCRWTS